MTEPISTTGTAAKVLGIGAAVLGGFGAAVQSRVNGTLAEHVGSGFGAAVISFGSGLLWLAVALACWPAARAGVGHVVTRLRDGELRWWELLGGVCGGFYVAAQGLTVGALGVALFMVAVVAGQSTSSVLVDRLGVAPGGVRLVTLGRVLGPGLTVVAVAIAVSGSVGRVPALGLAVVPFVAGALQSWQQAMNGRVRAAAVARADASRTGALGGVAAATVVNFLVGTTALLVVFAVSLVVAGRPRGALPADLPVDLVLYSGGLIGIAFIAVQAAIVHRIGVLLLGLGMIAGQVVGALVLDVVAPDAAPPGPAMYAGAALTLVAVAIPVVEARIVHRRRAAR